MYDNIIWDLYQHYQSWIFCFLIISFLNSCNLVHSYRFLKLHIIIFSLLGVPTGWHGRVDILFHGVAVTTCISTEDPESPGGEGNQSTVEIKASADILSYGREQMRAQTIVFSFFAIKNQTRTWKFSNSKYSNIQKKSSYLFLWL